MPEHRTSLLQVKMSPAERKELDALARTKGLTASAMVRLLVREAYDKLKQR